MDTATAATVSPGGDRGDRDGGVADQGADGGRVPPLDGVGSTAPTSGTRAGDHPAEDAGADDGRELPRRDREILAFERQWWKYAGVKEQAIRELFDMSATRYYQVVNALIDNPLAMAADPMLVKRLRRLRAARQRQRSARRLGIDV